MSKPASLGTSREKSEFKKLVSGMGGRIVDTIPGTNAAVKKPKRGKKLKASPRKFLVG